MKNLLIIIFLFSSFSFSQNNLNVTSITEQNEAVNSLDQNMSINMENSDIKNVLMLIGELTGLNIVISPAVKDTITASLIDVTVKAALDAILKPNGYSYFFQENIIVVKGSDTQMVGELETVVVKLNYINSSDLIGTLSAVLTPRGKVQPFTPLVSKQSNSGSSNIIVISDIQENINSVLKIIETLDVPIPNINIAIRFIETNLDTLRGFGIDWSRTPLSPGEYGIQDSSTTLGISLDNVTIATLNPLQLTNALKIMQARGQSKLLSSPQVTTLDNHEAETETVTTVYIEGNISNQNQLGQQGSQNQSSTSLGSNILVNQVQEKDIGIKLKVTPRINNDSKITMLVDAQVEALLSAAEIDTEKPRSTKRTVKTQVTVVDGNTAIIGGLIAENTLESKKFVPILSSIPLLGNLFKSSTIEKEQRELLIFITPTIVD
ncbi:secretin and TonB N-terminal domain-containing protein [bacterium]|nr:secretin and TonB N-terminal domain-containing protein [bacterium]